MRPRTPSRRHRVVWFVGDSITDGTGSTDGNGRRLLIMQTLAKYGWTTTGSVGTAAPNLQHDGHGGYTSVTIAGSPGAIYPNVATYYAKCTKPDLIVLLIGINDLHYDPTPANAAANVKSLRALLRSTVSGVKILQCSLMPIDNDAVATDANAVATNALIAADVAAESDVTWLDLHTPLYAGWIAGTYHGADGVHPNDAGYVAMSALEVPAILSIPWGP